LKAFDSIKSVFKKILFLLSMNEVNEKYWFRDFQKKLFYRFSERIITFFRRKTDFYEKKISVTLPSAVISKLSKWKFCPPDFRRMLSSKTRLPLKELVLLELFLYFWPQEQIPSGSCHTNFWLLFHFHVKYWPILMFRAWRNVKFYAELKKIYSLGSKVQSKAFGPKILSFLNATHEISFCKKSIFSTIKV
jgi:hypothetical protein